MANMPARPALRYIPFRKRDIVEMCIASGDLSSSAQMKFREVCTLLQSVYHFEYHRTLEALKDSYAPLNPDRDTRKVGVFASAEDSTFVEMMEETLNRANYEKFTDEELARAFEESSLFKLQLKIDWNDFDEVLLFTRGEGQRREKVKSWFGLREQEIEFANFDRVVIYIRFSDDLVVKRGYHRPGATLLKMFRNVPRSDIEMLFPNTLVGMRLIDKLMIGVPAVVGGGIILTTKLGTSLVLMGSLIGFYLGLHSRHVELDQAALLALLLGFGALGSFIWRQFSNFKTRKLTFMQALTENLYFRNLDNNAGVFHRLIDDAEEEECKEAILAYYFLVAHGPSTEAALDSRIEAWFADRWECAVDFEVDDALRKLAELALVEEEGGEFRVVEFDAALHRLDQRWDDYFDFDAPTAGRDDKRGQD